MSGASRIRDGVDGIERESRSLDRRPPGDPAPPPSGLMPPRSPLRSKPGRSDPNRERGGEAGSEKARTRPLLPPERAGLPSPMPLTSQPPPPPLEVSGVLERALRGACWPGERRAARRADSNSLGCPDAGTEVGDDNEGAHLFSASSFVRKWWATVKSIERREGMNLSVEVGEEHSKGRIWGLTGGVPKVRVGVPGLRLFSAGVGLPVTWMFESE
mmetsp:Transcript_30343/g.68030  ORF Transcript_30343/g.68030 Transcript_30343/m.68030 type:complete len:215 (-) Transcript_30343:82-726(-)